MSTLPVDLLKWIGWELFCITVILTVGFGLFAYYLSEILAELHSKRGLLDRPAKPAK